MQWGSLVHREGVKFSDGIIKCTNVEIYAPDQILLCFWYLNR